MNGCSTNLVAGVARDRHVVGVLICQQLEQDARIGADRDGPPVGVLGEADQVLYAGLLELLEMLLIEHLEIPLDARPGFVAFPVPAGQLAHILAEVGHQIEHVDDADEALLLAVVDGRSVDPVCSQIVEGVHQLGPCIDGFER